MYKFYIKTSWKRYYTKLKPKLSLTLLIFIFVLCRIFLNGAPDCVTLCSYQSITTHNRLIFDKNHAVEHFPEFICPQNFRNLADWVYGWPDDIFNEHLDTTTSYGHYISPCLAPGSIVFVKTDYLDKFFGEVYPSLKNIFVLITGQSDASSPGRYISYLKNDQSKIIHWFGQNADIYSLSIGRFTPIPIGINCYEMAEAIRSVYRRIPNFTVPSNFGGKDEPLEYIQPLDLAHKALTKELDTKLLLVNFQRKTDPTGIRSQVWESLCTRNVTSHFVLCIDKPDGVNITGLSNIYIRNRQHPLWLSPRGNGLDCHRTWEALYLDVIPIVWSSTLNSLYTGLPVIILNNSNEITDRLLRIKLQYISKKKVSSPASYQFEKLRFSYWRHMILSKSRHSATVIKRKNQCWRAKKSTETYWSF